MIRGRLISVMSKYCCTYCYSVMTERVVMQVTKGLMVTSNCKNEIKMSIMDEDHI